MTILLEAKIDDDPLHDQGVKSLLMLLQKTIYKDMRCVLQSGSFHNLTENKTLPQVILTFLYWSKLYQIVRHTTYMNTYTESTSECSQK